MPWKKPLLLLVLVPLAIGLPDIRRDSVQKTAKKTRKRTLLRVFSALMVVAGALIIASQFA